MIDTSLETMRMRKLRFAVLAIAGLCATYPAGAQSASEQPIARNGCLAFHEVHPQITAQEALQTQVPAGYKIYSSQSKEEGPLLLRDMPVVRGDQLKTAQQAFDKRTNKPIIAFTFNNAGARKFGNFTKDQVGRPYAIVLDEQVIYAPVIREPILGGSGIIGNFTVESANQLAAKLRSGICGLMTKE